MLLGLASEVCMNLEQQIFFSADALSDALKIWSPPTLLGWELGWVTNQPMHSQKHWQIGTLPSMDGSSGSYPGSPATVSDWRQIPPGFFCTSSPLGKPLANLSCHLCWVLPAHSSHTPAGNNGKKQMVVARAWDERWRRGEGGQGLERRSGYSDGLSLRSAALTKIVSHIKKFVWDWSGEVAANQLLPLKTCFDQT